ncbi:MAG TPA: T9SS type A sorting domain-containing protein [Chitinophagales bacterium]|nr:T9SS type A sorting domain-containing protein [Chitinophagales bacterium]
MKKFLSVLLLLTYVTCAIAQNAIPNAGFETWNVNPNYDDPQSWGTINGLTYALGVRTVTKATGANAHSGTAAIKLESKNIIIQGTAPGIAATGTINPNTQAVDGGVVFHRRPISITGWYKYIPNGVDTGTVSVYLWKWSNGARVEIGTAEIAFTTTVNTYTQFTADFDYSSTLFPDSMTVTLLTSSRAQGSPVGTQLFIDDLDMVMCNNFSASATAGAPATCTAANGTATVTVANSAGENVYNWSNSASTAAITAAAGTYIVTVTDGNLCSATASAIITATSVAINPSATSTSTVCTSNSGTATASASAGTTPYSFLWSNNATTATISNLGAGAVNVTVTDANGCSGTASTTVNSMDITITSTVVATPTSCGSSTGSVTVTPTNGTANYTYGWNVAGNSQTVSSLPAGSYQVTITDANGCSGTASGNVTTPNGPQATYVATGPSCNGGSNGSVNVTTTGGNGNLTYTWNPSFSTEDISGLSAGTYSLTINDANNCVFTLTAIVTEPDAITAVLEPQNVTCNGAADGEVTAMPSGGTGAYTYAWAGGSTGATVTGVDAGTINVTVSDANLCSASFTGAVTEPAALVIASPVVTPATCNGAASGSIDLTVSGGTPSYTYAWTSGTGEDPSGLSAGTYTVTVTDANGCTATQSATVTEPAVLGVTLTVTDASAFGASDGSISTAVTGGTANYTYAWSNSTTNADVSNLTAGNYCLTVTDNNSCTVSACDVVDAPSAIGNIADSNIKVYPNPATSFVTIEVENTSTFAVYTLEGRLVKETTINSGKTTVDVTQLPAGVYSYQLKNTSTGTVAGGNLQIEH